jgi:molybdenum-dependent DNA-binding transcriptional regulator ModE
MGSHRLSDRYVAVADNIVSNADLVIVHALRLYMAISVREMDVFRCVMQSGSVTNAAAALNISQPAVSRMLQQAEERLGFSLFEREKKRLKPTTEAQTLFAEVVDVFAAIEHTQRLAVELRDGQAGPRALVRPDWCSETKCDRLVERVSALRSGRCAIEAGSAIVRRGVASPFSKGLAKTGRIGKSDALRNLIDQQVGIFQKLRCYRFAYTIQKFLIREPVLGQSPV